MSTNHNTIAKLALAFAVALCAGGCAAGGTPSPGVVRAARAPVPASAPSPGATHSSQLRFLDMPPEALDFRMEARTPERPVHHDAKAAFPMQKASVGHRLRRGFAPLPSVE